MWIIDVLAPITVFLNWEVLRWEFSTSSPTHQLDVPHAPEAEGCGERARRVLGQVHALIAQHDVHVHLVDGLRHHHAGLVCSDPLIHRPIRVSLQEGVQLDVPSGEERTGDVSSHVGTGSVWDVSLHIDAREVTHCGFPSLRFVTSCWAERPDRWWCSSRPSHTHTGQVNHCCPGLSVRTALSLVQALRRDSGNWLQDKGLYHRKAVPLKPEHQGENRSYLSKYMNIGFKLIMGSILACQFYRASWVKETPQILKDFTILWSSNKKKNPKVQNIAEKLLKIKGLVS